MRSCPEETLRVTGEEISSQAAIEQSSGWETERLQVSSRLPKAQEQKQKIPGPRAMIGFFLTAHFPLLHSPSSSSLPCFPPLSYLCKSRKTRNLIIIPCWTSDSIKTSLRNTWGRPLACGHHGLCLGVLSSVNETARTLEVLVAEAGCVISFFLIPTGAPGTAQRLGLISLMPLSSS